VRIDLFLRECSIEYLIEYSSTRLIQEVAITYRDNRVVQNNFVKMKATYTLAL